MSVLIKALQKAEQGKRGDDKAPAPSKELALELAPLSAQADAGGAASEKAQASVAASGESKQAGRQAASAMFKAKNVTSSSAAAHRMWLLAGSGLVLFLILGIGFYSYLQSLQQPALPAPVQPQAAVATTELPNASAVPAMTAPPADPAPAAKTDGVPVADEALNDMPSVMQDKKPESQPTVVAASAPQKPQPAVPQSFGEPVAAAAPVMVTVNAPEARVNPAVQAAYQAYMAGNDNTAQDFYRQALRTDIRNVDALLGMAAIALRQRRNNDAAGWYGKVLEVEPRNGVAQAAMISLLGTADPVAHESHIKNLLAQKPDAAYLHAALGSLYAGQDRWPAAQQAYFDAYHFDNDNAEYAFNLAVSLDHLGKSSLALQYYKQAQALLTDAAITKIDRTQLATRIAQLQ